jgi:hypothetical protein
MEELSESTRKSIEEGLRHSAEGQTHYLGSFAQYAEEEDDEEQQEWNLHNRVFCLEFPPGVEPNKHITNFLCGLSEEVIYVDDMILITVTDLPLTDEEIIEGFDALCNKIYQLGEVKITREKP